jgi:hypothetical protein
MTSTTLTFTPLRWSWRAHRWPLHLWGGHDDHPGDLYTSEVVMTSTPVTFMPLRWSWRALRWPLHLWGGHNEHATERYTSKGIMTSTPVTSTPLRWSWRAFTSLRQSWLTQNYPLYLWDGHNEHSADHCISEAVMTNTTLTILPLKWS